MKFATLVWRNLRRSPRRTILTMLAIALAAFTYSSLSSLPNVARRMLNTPDSARRIVVMSDSGFFNRLPDSYKPKILAAPHVVAASGLVYFGGVYHSPSDQLGIAVDADQAELMWPDWGVTPVPSRSCSAILLSRGSGVSACGHRWRPAAFLLSLRCVRGSRACSIRRAAPTTMTARPAG